MPEIRFQVTDTQAELLSAVARTEALPETELSRRAWARGLMELAVEHAHIANELDPELLSASRPGALPDSTLALIASLADRPLVAIVAELERQGIPTARGGHWTPTTVSRALARARARGLGQDAAAVELAQEPEPEPEPEPAQEPAKRRGRRAKSTSAAVELAQEPAPAKRRGRRAAQEPAQEPEPVPTKRRGRPRKDAAVEPAKRGRPRKAQGKAPRKAKG